MGIDWGGGGTLEGNGCGWWTGSCTSVCWMGQCPASVHGAALHVREGALQWREPSEGKEVVGEEQYCRGGLGVERCAVQALVGMQRLFTWGSAWEGQAS
jgi:hypothetical protein